jgi:hypothetical protein
MPKENPVFTICPTFKQRVTKLKAIFVVDCTVVLSSQLVRLKLLIHGSVKVDRSFIGHSMSLQKLKGAVTAVVA